MSLYKQGHCAYPEEKSFEESIQRLETPKEQLEDILELEIIEHEIIVDSIGGSDCLHFNEIWILEKKVSEMLFLNQGILSAESLNEEI